ncbi:hypothetical protein PL9214490023 [Planktothrix tepida PCC 9214]|uniref:APAF-1 helical domain-containing protein n=2 Tax=Planktothrix TaxID=54304 RepID=A0A1J1LKN4_9CYAN|nr:hypothetical protein PL9214490023 [Planktothrix tepida PCC 9214]
MRGRITTMKKNKKKRNFYQSFTHVSPSKQRIQLQAPRISLENNNLKKYYRILTDFDFLSAKIAHPEFGIDSLIEDYQLRSQPGLINAPDADRNTDTALQRLQETLTLSAHILRQDPNQLISQLWGRLQPFQTLPAIQSLLTQSCQSQDSPCLRPLTPSLTPPGTGLQ